MPQPLEQNRQKNIYIAKLNTLNQLATNFDYNCDYVVCTVVLVMPGVFRWGTHLYMSLLPSVRPLQVFRIMTYFDVFEIIL